MFSSDLVPARGEQMECGLVHTGCTTPLTVHQYHETFDPLQWIDSIPNMLGFKVSASNMSATPDCPGGLIATSNTLRSGVTSR